MYLSRLSVVYIKSIFVCLFHSVRCLYPHRLLSIDHLAESLSHSLSPAQREKFVEKQRDTERFFLSLSPDKERSEDREWVRLCRDLFSLDRVSATREDWREKETERDAEIERHRQKERERDRTPMRVSERQREERDGNEKRVEREEVFCDYCAERGHTENDCPHRLIDAERERENGEEDRESDGDDERDI